MRNYDGQIYKRSLRCYLPYRVYDSAALTSPAWMAFTLSGAALELMTGAVDML